MRIIVGSCGNTRAIQKAVQNRILEHISHEYRMRWLFKFWTVRVIAGCWVGLGIKKNDPARGLYFLLGVYFCIYVCN